jgi:hypothetical protein
VYQRRNWNARRSLLPPRARRRSSNRCGPAPSARVPAEPESLGPRRRPRLLRLRTLRPRSSRQTAAGLMPPENDLGPGLFPLAAVNGSGPAPVDEQLALVGEPSPVRIPAVEWKGWLSDKAVQARYWAKVYRTSSPADCWFFFGGISSTGHASFRAASRPGRTRRGTVPGHLYGYQLAPRCHPSPRLGNRQPDRLPHLRQPLLPATDAPATGHGGGKPGRMAGPPQRPGQSPRRPPRPGRTLPRHRRRHPGWPRGRGVQIGDRSTHPAAIAAGRPLSLW